MLEVYHWEPNGASGRILIALAEKGLEFTAHYVDVLALAHYRPPVRDLCETGEIPILVLEGAPYSGETQVAELLEETFAQNPLMPADPLGRWAVRVWQKYVDDGLAAWVSDLAWSAYAPRGDSVAAARLRAAVETITDPQQRAEWRAALDGHPDERLAQARAHVASAVAKIESALAGTPWLAGDSFSLADAAVFPYLRYLPALVPRLLDAASAPRTRAWLRAVGERPAVRGALGRGRAADPFTVAAPGPQSVRWG